MSNYDWIDNPTENGVAVCDTDVLNECLMHLKYNNQKIKSTLNSFNSGNINSNGNSELFDFTAPTEINLTIAETYTINIPTSDYYSVKLVGGGGDGRTALNIYGTNTYSYGGSGAAFVGEVFLNAGFHNLIVGGANSSSILYDENGNALITANGGNNGGSDYGGATNGAGGVLTISPDAQTQNVTVQSNGGTGVNGSKYNNYGQGGYGNSNSNRTDGYFSIVLPSAINNISYKVGGSYPSLVGTLASGEQFTLNGLNSDDITGLADGTYLKYVGSDGSSELLKANLTVAKTVPSTPADNDVWINNSVSPLSVKKYVATNYTIVGSPTITADGIASNFSSSNYIKVNNITLGDTYSIEGEASFSGDGTFLSFITSGNKDLSFNYDSSAQKIKVFNSIGWTAEDINIGETLTHLKYKLNGDITNSIYTFIYEINNSGQTQSFTFNGVNTKIILGDVSFLTLGNSGYAWTAAWALQGTIDLKEFKIYVDGDLVYQPNIPNGWVEYNKVPLGKITLSSGTITEAKTFPYNIDYVGNNVIETYQNGTEGYRVWSDGLIEQWGTVSGEPYYSTPHSVSFLKTFSDNNYTLLCKPINTTSTYTNYDASAYGDIWDKSASGFNTFVRSTQDAAWYAIGY